MLLGLKRQRGEPEGKQRTRARHQPAAAPSTSSDAQTLCRALGEVEVRAGAGELGEGLAHSQAIPARRRRRTTSNHSSRSRSSSSFLPQTPLARLAKRV